MESGEFKDCETVEEAGTVLSYDNSFYLPTIWLNPPWQAGRGRCTIANNTSCHYYTAPLTPAPRHLLHWNQETFPSVIINEDLE
jgi:hypothetical protein